MKVWVTLDKIDGSASEVRGPFNPDEINTFGLLMYLNRGDVAGVTFTRENPLSLSLASKLAVDTPPGV